MAEIKKYIVALTKFTKKEELSRVDSYHVFIDGHTSEDNYTKAKAKYDSLLNLNSTAICSLCKILESTDY